MNIELPPSVGIIPSCEQEYNNDWCGFEYRAVIDVVGSYKEMHGWDGDKIRTHSRQVWASDKVDHSEEDAVERAVEKLADLLKGLL